MYYALLGFIFGFLIPYMARRFAKFMPATPAYAIYRLIWPVKTVSKQKRSLSTKYHKLIKKYIMRSIGWAIVSGALSAGIYFCFLEPYRNWLLFLILTLLLLYEIDERMFLLPDILTIPLLIGGFAYTAFAYTISTEYTLTPIQISVLGAIAGYILPTIASLFLIKKHPDCFGGGDIKLLAALGAWLGLESVPLLILLSSAIFAIISIIKKQRAGAFGPSIVIAAIILVFFNI
jgi:prepilin signal peptidase PulO-like enzyme (type II secretory pathway)